MVVLIFYEFKMSTNKGLKIKFVHINLIYMNISFKQFTVTFILTLSTTILFSQNEKNDVLAKFIITEATINGIDETAFYLDQSCYTVFYTFEKDNLIYMANYCDKENTQSFGPMYATESLNHEETSETYEAEEFNFSWRYTNNYNDNTGTAKVLFTKIYKPNGITFTIKIIPKNLDLIVFSGYMEGSIDFSKY